DAPFGEQRSRSLRAADEWTRAANIRADYGAIILPDPSLGLQVGAFEISAFGDAEITGPEANLSGYPIDRDDGLGTRQYYHARRIARVTPELLYYDIDTFGGMSGAPIWVRVGQRRVVIGIHSTGSPAENWGVRINQQVAAALATWSVY